VKDISLENVTITIRLTMDELNTALESLDFFIREGVEQHFHFPSDALRIEDIEKSKIYKLRGDMTKMLVQASNYKDSYLKEAEKDDS
tara:strand:- start:429 stop:689 length:261 start_codon:yes stop_codon:yes gene_type:complete